MKHLLQAEGTARSRRFIAMFENVLPSMRTNRHRTLLSLGIAVLLSGTSCSQTKVSPLSSWELESESVVNQILAEAKDRSEPLLPSILEPDLTATQAWKIAYISKEPRVDSPQSANDVYWYSAWIGVREAATALNVKAENHSIPPGTCLIHEECILPQINIVNQLIEQRSVDGIVIGPTDSFRLAAVIEKATAAGIPVVPIDTPIDTENVLSFVVLNSYDSGKQMGEWVADTLGEKGNVLILTGPHTDQNSTDRHRGILAGLNGSEIVVLDTQSADWLEDRSQEITADWLQEFPTIDAILSSNDAMALGAIAAIKAAKRDGILVTGYDGLPPAMNAIRDGALGATIQQNPVLQSKIATQILVQYLEKQSDFPPVIFLPGSPLVTSENVPQK